MTTMLIKVVCYSRSQQKSVQYTLIFCFWCAMNAFAIKVYFDTKKLGVDCTPKKVLVCKTHFFIECAKILVC